MDPIKATQLPLMNLHSLRFSVKTLGILPTLHDATSHIALISVKTLGIWVEGHQTDIDTAQPQKNQVEEDSEI